MSKLKFLSLTTIILFSVSSFAQSQEASKISNDYAFVVKGSTGKNVMLDVTWYKDCVDGGYGTWDKSMRTMSGHELSTTIIKYQNGSKTPDCTNGAAMITVFVQTLKSDNVQVPIVWTDTEGKPANAPIGLENVKTGNGATGTVTYATITPLTKEQADGLNYIKMGGLTDWSAGSTKDMLSYFSMIGEMKGTVVVDDRTNIGAVYDGISSNPKEYPTLIPNTAPHKGKLNGIKF